MNIRTSIWTSYFIDFTPEEAVRHFASRNWDELEFSTEHSAALLKRGEPGKVGKEFKAYCSDLGVSCPQGHLWLQSDIAATNQDEVLDILKRWLDLYMAIGIKAAVVHPGGAEMEKKGSSPEAVLEAQTQALRTLAGHARGTITLCIENVIRPDEITRLLTIIKACGCDGLGICLDTGHLNMFEKNPGAFIRAAGPLLKAIHLADNNGTADQHLMPYGFGTVRWDEVGPALKEIGFSGPFNFEIPGEIRCPLAVRLAKLDFLKAILPTLIAGGFGRS